MATFGAGAAAPAFAAQLITISSTKPRQVCWAGNGPVYLVNRDLLTIVYLGSDEGMDPTGNDNGVLDPLGTMPLPGDADVWALTQAGTAIVNVLPGTSAWAPSPAQIAAQIAAAGLATAVNQAAQITGQNANTTVVQAINANHAALQSQMVNPYFTGPNGNADATGWAASGAAIVAAGQGAGVALPAGSGFANGVQLTPNTTSLHPVLEAWGNGVPCFAITPGQQAIGHFMLDMTTVANAPNGVVEFNWYGPTGTFLSQNLVATPLLATIVNRWMKISGMATAPAGAAFGNVAFGISELANVGPGDVFYIAGAIGHALGNPGSAASDHALHIAQTGINGNLPSLLDTETLSGAAGAWGPFVTALPACGSFLLAITPTTPANPMWSDFTIDHLDDAGNVVHTDFFSAYGGSWPGLGVIGSAIQMSGPTLLRGNIYGSQLRVSGARATAANVNTITGSAGIVMSGFTYRLYSLPYNVPDAMPKMSNGSASLLALGITPSNLLASWMDVAIGAGSSVSSPIVPYAGPAVVATRVSGASMSVQIYQYTVANGAVKAGKQVVDQPVASATTDMHNLRPYNVAACLNLIQITNNGAVGDVADVALLAAVSA